MQNESTPEGGTVWYGYTANDLVSQVYNQRNITVTNSYNSRNLLTGVSYSDGTPAVSFSYDDFGARTSMTDGEGQTIYSYNSLRQLESETRTFTALSGNHYKLSYSYNVAGQPTQVNYGVYTLSGGGNPVYSFNKNVNYDYNGVSALKGLGTNLLGNNPDTTTNVISAAAYRASGAVNVPNYGNGRRLTMGYYQQRSQPASIKVDLAGNPADKIIDYADDYYDANGANNNRIRKLTGAIFLRSVLERSTLRCDCFRALMASGKMLSNQWRVIVTGKCGSLRVSASSLPSRASSMTLNP